jgi:hypothetical protein
MGAALPARAVAPQPINLANRSLTACSHCILAELSCSPPVLPHVPVEALLWVLSTENGCELRIFESAAGRPTLQVRFALTFHCNGGLITYFR